MILLDTHILLWMASDPGRLTKRAVESIRHARQNQTHQNAQIAIATITLWELAWLGQNRRIVVTGSVESFVRETAARVALRPMTAEIAALAARLPEPFPKDPADRLIASTAIVEGFTLITADARIRKSKVVETIW